MSKQQWGHGYYKGVEDALKAGTPLVNKPVHILRECMIHNQGVILGVNEDGDYLIQRYSFFDGCPTDIIIMTKNDMADTAKVRIYHNEYEWHKAYCREQQDLGRLKGTVENNATYFMRDKK